MLMGKNLKRIVLGVGAALLLLLAAAVVLPFLFKDKIEALAKEELNKSLSATVQWGDWDLSLLRSFPNLTVTVGEVRVCNKAPFEGTCLADIGSFTATVDVMSLFRDQVRVERIALRQPKLNFRVLADGRANWDITLVDSTAAPTPEDTATSAFNLALSSFRVEDGQLIYHDATLPMIMDLAGLDLEGSGDMTQDLFTLRTELRVDSTTVAYDGVKYLSRAVTNVKADLGMDLANMKFTFQQNEITVNRMVLGLDGWLAMPEEDIEMDLKWQTRKDDLGTLLSLVPSDFARDLDGVEMSGKAAFSGYVKGTYGETQLPGFGLVVALENGRFKYPDLPHGVEEIFVDCKIQSPQGADMDGVVVDLRRFALRLAGNPVSARMHLTTPISDPNVDADLSAALDLASIAQVVPMEKEGTLQGKLAANVHMKGRMSDVEHERYEKFDARGELRLNDMAYKSVDLPYGLGINSMRFAFSPQALKLVEYNGTVGSSDIAASGSLSNYLAWWLRDSTLTGAFEVAAQRFDLNELMTTDTTATTAAATPATENAPGVIEVPSNINFLLTTSLREVIYDQLHLSDCKGALHVHDARVDLRDVFFKLFGGSVSMNGGYDTRDVAHPRIDLRYDVKDLDIENTVKYVETVQKIAPIAKACKGRFSTSLTMDAELDQAMQPLMQTLAGAGTLTTSNVRVEGFKPLMDLADALKIANLRNTTLQDVKFSFRFSDGKMITEPFNVRLGRIQANVGGTTAFEDQAIDYALTAKMPTDLFGAQANQLVGGLLGKANSALGSNFQAPQYLDLTASITGTVNAPIVKPVFAGGGASVKETVTQQVKQELNQQIDKAKEEAIAKARAEADRLLAEAQKQADEMKTKLRAEAAAAKAEAYKRADAELAKVTNPLAKAAARLLADKTKQAADAKESQLIAEGDKRADGLVSVARTKGDALIQQAEATNTTVK
jgi:uncharacterized protein involved in outer membrane biogenesis